MAKTLNTPSNSLHKRQGEDKHFEAQMKRVFAAFKRKPSTMLMVSIETGILRANICRYVAKWQKSNSIHLWHELNAVSATNATSAKCKTPCRVLYHRHEFIYSTLKTVLI
jgi:hypothetical protein